MLAIGGEIWAKLQNTGPLLKMGIFGGLFGSVVTAKPKEPPNIQPEYFHCQAKQANRATKCTDRRLPLPSQMSHQI